MRYRSNINADALNIWIHTPEFHSYLMRRVIRHRQNMFEDGSYWRVTILTFTDECSLRAGAMSSGEEDAIHLSQGLDLQLVQGSHRVSAVVGLHGLVRRFLSSARGECVR